MSELILREGDALYTEHPEQELTWLLDLPEGDWESVGIEWSCGTLEEAFITMMASGTGEDIVNEEGKRVIRLTEPVRHEEFEVWPCLFMEWVSDEHTCLFIDRIWLVTR